MSRFPQIVEETVEENTLGESFFVAGIAPLVLEILENLELFPVKRLGDGMRVDHGGCGCELYVFSVDNGVEFVDGLVDHVLFDETDALPELEDRVVELVEHLGAVIVGLAEEAFPKQVK